VAITTLGGPLRSLTTRIVAFGGPLVASGPDGTRGINTLLDAYQRRGARKSLFTEVRNLVDATDVASALASRGFRHENHLNFLVDLTIPEEEQWRRVAPSARRNIQSARRNGVTVVEAQHPLEVAAGYEVLRDVYARIQVPLPDRSLFDAADAILRPLERFKILLAKLDDHVIGVLTLLLYKDTVLYWYTGTLRAHARSRPGDLLVWHAIELARAGGYRVLDFGGAGKPDEPYGVRDFKAKYGGQLVDHGRDVWVPRDVRLRVATAGYEKLRKFL
jgi:hypothetical protein